MNQRIVKKPVMAGMPDPNKPIAERYTTQADRVFAKFGNKHRLCQALNDAGYKINKSTLTRWGQPEGHPFATGGVIPARPMKAITRLAIDLGVVLDVDCYRPTLLPAKKEQEPLN